MKFRYRNEDEMKDSGVKWSGNIPKENNVIKMKFCSEFINGYAFKSDDLQSDKDIPVIRIGDIRESGIDTEKALKIDNETAEKLQQYRINTNDVLIAMSGATVGKTMQIKEKLNLLINQRVGIVRAKQINHRFLFYNLNSSKFKEEILLTSVGGAQENISSENIQKKSIVNFSIGEQIKIAKFLDDKTIQFDTIVSKKEDLIKRLEEAKKSLISEVVTGKVKVVKTEGRYELEERKKEDMRESGVEWIGKIPKKWDVKKIKHIAALRSGDSITSDNIEVEGEYPVYGGNGKRGYTDKYTHDGTYILIGRQGALCGNINYAYEQFWASEHAVVVNPVVEIDLLWLGELLRSMHLNQYSETAAQPGLAVGMIQNLRIPYTTLNEQKIISELIKEKIDSTDYIIERTKIQIKKIKEAKQSLISEVVTGKIEIL